MRVNRYTRHNVIHGWLYDYLNVDSTLKYGFIRPFHRCFNALKLISDVRSTFNQLNFARCFQVFFCAACEGKVLQETGYRDKPYFVNFNTDAVVTNFEILRDFLLNWRIWYTSGSSLSWEMVLHALEALTSSNHRSSQFNIRQFERAEALGALLLGCQVS